MFKFLAILLALQLFAPNLFVVEGVICPVEEDPANLARCIQVDVTAIVYAARGKDDLTSLCALADRYMECIKTYTRGCTGFYFGEGSLTELQNIALYCCKGTEVSLDCPFNSKVQKCFDDGAFATMSTGEHKLLKDIRVGDSVKTLDSEGNLIDTDVIMLMDKSNKKSLFFNIRTYTNKSLSVSSSHLIAVPGGFKLAKRLFTDDSIILYDFEKNERVEDKISSILIEQVEGYVAPLTMEGTILVNNMLASCYAVVESHNLGHTVMAPARWFYKLTGVFNQVTSAEAAHDTSEDIHWYPQFLYTLTDNYLSDYIKLN